MAPPRPQSSSYPKFDTGHAVDNLSVATSSEQQQEEVVGTGMFFFALSPFSL